METMTVAIYGSRRQQQNFDRISSLLKDLSFRGARLILHAKLYSHLCDLNGGAPDGNWNIYAVTDSDRFTADLALSIGGDGTFLRTARWVGDKNIPIAGINAGHLGFLTSFVIEDTEGFISGLFNGSFRIESRAMIEVSVPSMPEFTPIEALNEVVAIKADTASMITVDAVLDGYPLATYLADGLIVSTATGSTGYNLSAGGPILQPRTPSFVITPIAAHTLTMRPLVVADSSHIELTVTSRADSFLMCTDGNYHHLPCGVRLSLKKSPHSVRILMPADETFAEKIRAKLLWGAR